MPFEHSITWTVCSSAMARLLGGGGGSGVDCFWRFDAVALSNAQQSHAKRVAWLLRFPRSEIRNSCLPTASLLGNLALRDALFGYGRDVVFPLHGLDYIGLPMFLQAVCRYRNSVCYAE